MTSTTHIQRGLNAVQLAHASTPVPHGQIQRKCACGSQAGSHGECEECRTRRLQRKSLDSGHHRDAEVPGVVHEALSSPGQPLGDTVRSLMESRFDQDFSRVRVHTDVQAVRSARAVDAIAYTVGNDVVFDHGHYAPDTTIGQRLLAHELTHVVQQGGMGHTRPGVVGPAEGPDEMIADRTAEAIAGSHRADAFASSSATGLQRQNARPADPREQIIALGESQNDADRQRALDLIIDTYYERPPHFGRIVYDPNLRSQSPQDAETGPAQGQPQFGGRQIIHIGPRFFNSFRERFEQRARTIGHELQHVGQLSPANQRTAGRTIAGIGLGLGVGLLAAGAGLGIASWAGASLSSGLIGGVLAGGAVLGGVIGGLADPFRKTDEPIRDRNTREFLAIHWVVTAQVPGLRALPPGQILQNITQPGEGALDRYQRMPAEDQQRYRRQYDEILEIQRRLGNQRRGNTGGPAAR